MKAIAVIFFALAGLFLGGCALWGWGVGVAVLFHTHAYTEGAGILAVAALGFLIALRCFRMAGRYLRNRPPET